MPDTATSAPVASARVTSDPVTSGAGTSGAGTSGAGTSGAGTSGAGTSGAGTSGAVTSGAGTSPVDAAWTHEPVPTAAGQVRRTVRALLAGHGVARERAEDALLVLEELVVNVLDHARTRFRLAVRLGDGVLHLAVRDHAAGAPDLRPHDPRAARGRGLQLVAALTDRWGCEAHADGKTVWAELRV